eukprot:1546921-Alexandrium_andersonii.AAC.1
MNVRWRKRVRAHECQCTECIGCGTSEHGAGERLAPMRSRPPPNLAPRAGERLAQMRSRHPANAKCRHARVRRGRESG